jgi:lipase (class 3)
MLRKAKIAAAVVMAAFPAVAAAPALAEHEGGPAGVLFRILRAVKGESRKIDAAAMRVYEGVPRTGSCEERRARIVALLPDALRFARLARDVGEGKTGAKMKAAGVTTLDLGSGRTAHFHANGERYAEVVTDDERHQAIVVFEGTRLAVKSDVTTDVINFLGLKSGYHRWASELVAKVVSEHQGMEVIATGHSLGGGLAIYAVLQNPGVRGFAFNPAGLSLLTWAKANDADRARTSAALTVVSTRSDDHIEPVTAISFAGRSVLPGHILVLETDAKGPVALHGSSTVVKALEQVESSGASGEVCEGDLGELVD